MAEKKSSLNWIVKNLVLGALFVVVVVAAASIFLCRAYCPADYLLQQLHARKKIAVIIFLGKSNNYFQKLVKR